MSILRWSSQIQLRIGNAPLFDPILHAIRASSALSHGPTLSATDKGDATARTFKLTVNFFPSMAKLVDGSIQNIERDTIVKWEVEFTEIDPQVLQNMGETAVKKWVEKIGENIVWGPEQEVSLLRFDDWKGEYARIEDGEQIVEEIDRQNGWISKWANFFAELVDLNIFLKVGYVPSQLAAQMVDDDWASQRQITPMFTGEVTVIGGLIKM